MLSTSSSCSSKSFLWRGNWKMENWIFGEWKSSREWRAVAGKATECFNWKSPLDLLFCLRLWAFNFRSFHIDIKVLELDWVVCRRFAAHFKCKKTSLTWNCEICKFKSLTTQFVIYLNFVKRPLCHRQLETIFQYFHYAILFFLLPSRVFRKIILRLHWSIKLAHTKRMDFLPTVPSRSSNSLETSAIEHFTSRNVHIPTLRCDIRPRYPHEIKMNSQIQLKSFLRGANRAQSSYSWRHMCELVIRCHAWSTSLRDTQNDIEIYKSSKVEIWFWRVLAHSAMRIASNWNMQPSFRHWERFTFIDFFFLFNSIQFFFVFFVSCVRLCFHNLYEQLKTMWRQASERVLRSIKSI